MRPFFEKSGDPQSSPASLKLGHRIAGTLLCAAPTLAIFCILMLALYKNGTHRLIRWLSGHVVTLVGGLFLLIYGLVTLLRPDIVLRGIQSAYPDRKIGEHNLAAERFMQILGLFLLGLSLLLFLKS